MNQRNEIRELSHMVRRLTRVNVEERERYSDMLAEHVELLRAWRALTGRNWDRERDQAPNLMARRA